MNLDCQQLPLDEVLQGHCDQDTESRVQSHLDHCQQCQQRLATLAADQDTWANAAQHLSTLKSIRLDPQLENKLSQSRSFVVPTSEFRPGQEFGQDPSHSIRRPPEWTRLLDPPKHPEMLGQIDQFEIDSKIGQGGMGIVLKGFDRELNRPVAIKLLSPHLASHGTARKRFAREAQAAAAVVHPNVVPIYSVNQSVERPYLVMQLVSGKSLQSLVESNGPLEPRDVVRIAIQIADGLAAAHQQGLIHRDVKPANVLTEKDASRVMITDFGLARAVDDAGMTQTGWLAGTPHYMSPEQSRGDDLDPRSDLFSLGSLIYFLATGREPFRADKPYGVIQKIIHDAPRPAHAVAAEVPVGLSDVIAKLLAKKPEDRFESADQLASYLRDYLAHLQQPAAIKPPPRLSRRRLWPVAVSALLTVVVTATAIAGWQLGWLPFSKAGQSSVTTTVAPGDTTTPVVPSSNLGDQANPMLQLEMTNDELLNAIDQAERELAELERLFDTMPGAEIEELRPPNEYWPRWQPSTEHEPNEGDTREPSIRSVPVNEDELKKPKGKHDE